jgi:pyruvate,water dikinase
VSTKSPLIGKQILVVDDEPDVLETVEELLNMCQVHTAKDFDTALQLIMRNTYDTVILDIMGVDGFELLKNSVARDFPTLMLTAHAATPESLRKSFEIGAVSFLPKEMMIDLEEIMENVVIGGRKQLWWRKSLDNTDPYFEKKFGSNWRDKDKLFKKFEASIKKKKKMEKKLCFWFDEIGQGYNDIVGKKCANLGEMIQMDLPVPPGFALSLDMCRRFINETGAYKEMLDYVDDLGELTGKKISEYREISKTLQGFIENKEMPPDVEKIISTYYNELCERLNIPDMAVSVRSAGTESRPGMFKTYLNVCGINDVLAKVKKVWASSYTTRAVAFRINKGLPVIGDELGVAIPKMVNARASGITFNVDPVTGDTTKIVVEANWGLGEGVVSGAESVDGFMVDKDSLEVSTRHVGKKTKCVVYTENGADWTDVSENMQSTPCISDEELIEISKVAKSVEKTLDCPQDMEWAIDKDLEFPKSIFWLQTRPAKVAAQKIVSTAAHIADLMAKKLKGI